MKEDNIDKPNGGHSGQRARYTKPKLMRISLKAEDMVLASCKTQGGGGPIGNHCRQGQTPCVSFGL